MNNIRKKAKWIYDSQKSRCYNKNNPNYKNYGAKGIKVIYGWNDFFNWYLANIKCGYVVGRINHDGNYDFENIRPEMSRSFCTKERNTRYPNPSLHKQKKVLIYHSNSQLIAIASSVKQASECSDVPLSTINRDLKCLIKKSNKGRWRFKYA